MMISDNPGNFPKFVNWAVGKTHNVILIGFNQLENKSLVLGGNNKPIDIVIIEPGGNKKETIGSVINRMKDHQLVVLVHHNRRFAEDVFGFYCGGSGQPEGKHLLSALSGFEVGLAKIVRERLSQIEPTPKRLPGRGIFSSA